MKKQALFFSILAVLASETFALGVPPARGATWVGRPVLAEKRGLRLSLVVPNRTAKAGDRIAVTATVTNDTGRPVSGGTVLLGLIDMTPRETAPLGLETWTGDPESVALPVLAPGGSASAVWHLVLIQPGPLGIYASALNGAGGSVESSPVEIVRVADRQVLNPGNVLPVAMGEPALLLAFLGFLRFTSSKRAG